MARKNVSYNDDIPPAIRKAMDRDPLPKSDEGHFRKMLENAGQDWVMTANEKDWHGYHVEGFAWSYLMWFDPFGNCLGMVGEED